MEPTRPVPGQKQSQPPTNEGQNVQPPAQPREARPGRPPATCSQEKPRHRSRGPQTGPTTQPMAPGQGAEGGGGWPMHATVKPWHAEGRLLPTGALRRLLSSLAQRRAGR